MRCLPKLLVVLLLCAPFASRGGTAWRGSTASRGTAWGEAAPAHAAERQVAAATQGAPMQRAGGQRPVEARFLRALPDSRSCKPRAPIAVSLLQAGVHDGSVVDLVLDVTPHASVGALRWELLLPEGSELVEGERSGELAAGAAGTGPLHVSVRLPTSADFARVSLVAESCLQELAAPGTARPDPAGAPDPVRSSASLAWGRPPAATFTRRLLDVERGRMHRVAEVPGTHRGGG
jgi:hypothetical protein